MKRLVVIGVLASVIVAGAISYYASSKPDGFERAAGILGENHADETGVRAPMPDYQVGGLNSQRLAGGLAGIAGVVVTFVVCVIVGKLVARRRTVENDEE